MATTATLSKQEYLKRYLSPDATSEPEKKKKLRKKKLKQYHGMRIIDQDCDVEECDGLGLAELETGEDAPVAIDLRPAELKHLETFQQDSKWKVIGKDDRDQPGTSSEQVMSSKSSQRRPRHDSSSEDEWSHQKTASNSKKSIKCQVKRERTSSTDSDLSVDRSRSKKSSRSSKAPSSVPVKGRADADSDLSPPRIKQEPPSSDSDLSPLRRRSDTDPDSDLSPPRKDPRKSESPGPSTSKDVKPRKTLSGATAGLQSADALRREQKKLKRKEDRVFDQMSEDVSGRNREAVMRNKKEIRGSKYKEKKKELTEEEKARLAEMQKRYTVWNKGVKQVDELNAKAADIVHEMDKPLARYKGDEDLEGLLREKELQEDPMLAYVKKKKRNDPKFAKKEYPKYKGPWPPPNRYGILPGYRWDGLDRSNGFESKLLSRKNTEVADKEELYRFISEMRD